MVQILQGTGPEGGGRGNSEATRLRLASPGRLDAMPCALPARAWKRTGPPACFHVLSRSLQLPASPTTFLFSVLRASALLLRAPPLPSGQVPLALGAWGGPACHPLARSPCPKLSTAARSPVRGGAAGPWGRGAVGPGPGKGGPAARVELRMTSGLAPPSPHCCCLSDSRTPLATPQLGRHCPSLLVESFASGSGKQPGGHPRIEDGSRSGRPYWAGPGGRETGSRSAVTAWPSTARVRAPPQPLCVSPLSQTLSPAQQDSWVPR